MTIPFAYVLAPLIPLMSATLIPVVSKVSSRARENFSVSAAASTLVVITSMIPDVLSAGQIVARLDWVPVTGGEAVVVVDALSLLMSTITSLIGLLTILYSVDYMKNEYGLTRYYSFLLLSIGGMIGLFLSGNFLQLYLFWELVGICSYALIGFRYEKPSAAKAGTKAFLVTRIGGTCLLLGMLWIHSYTHTFDMISVNRLVNMVPISVLQISSILFLFRAMAKSAQLPFYIWLPDAMEAPTPASALIHAATMVNAGVYLVARIHPMFSSVPVFFTTSMYIGISTAFLTATMALTTDDIKRLLAYSTVSQLGYAMFILGMETPLAYFARVFFIFSHAIFKALLFLCAGAVIHAAHTRKMEKMGGLWRDMPVTFVMCLGGAAALAGLPPFNGFFSKELILTAAEKAGHPYLTVIAAATTALTLVYCLKMIQKVFFGHRSRNSQALETPLLMKTCLRVLAASCVLSVLLEEPLLSLFKRSELITVIDYSGFDYFSVALSIGAVTLGLGVFTARGRISRFIKCNGSTSIITALVENGYVFNRLYSTLSSSILKLSTRANKLIERRILQGFDHSVARSFLKLSTRTNRLIERRLLQGFDYSIARSFPRISKGSCRLAEQGMLEGFNESAAKLALDVSSVLTRIQTGSLSWSMIEVTIGFFVILLLIVSLGGARI